MRAILNRSVKPEYRGIKPRRARDIAAPAMGNVSWVSVLGIGVKRYADALLVSLERDRAVEEI